MIGNTPAVVLGAGINGLGVARSLALARVRVWLADSDSRRPEMHTRAARSLPIESLHGDALINELVRLGSTRFAGVRPVLMLTQEESVKLVSRHRERLTGLYRFNLPTRELVETLQHKHGFQRLAEQLGCPIPALVRIGSVDELGLLEQLRYPVVVKPGERHEAYSRQFKKAYRMASASEAAALVRRILPVMPDVVVQEWTEGPDSNIYFCLQYLDRHARVTASFTGRKVRSWPPQVGGTASCMPAPEADAELSAMTTRFFREAGVTGLAAMEYKRDSRNGQFRMVEPTIGRTDYQAEVATLNGVNLPYAAYCDMVESSCMAGRTMRSVGWRVRSEDVQSAAMQGQRENDGFDGCADVADALWRWSDPVPSVLRNLRRVRNSLKLHVVKKLPKSRPLESKS